MPNQNRSGSFIFVKKLSMTVPIEVPNTITLEALKGALAQIKTLSVTHVQTDSLHLKVNLETIYPQDIFEAGQIVWFFFARHLIHSSVRWRAHYTE